MIGLRGPHAVPELAEEIEVSESFMRKRFEFEQLIG